MYVKQKKIVLISFENACDDDDEIRKLLSK